MSNQEAVDRFIEIKKQIGLLEKELDEIKANVFAAVDQQEGEIAADNYTIKSYRKPKYKFSDSYTAKNDELKQLKKKEIEEGTAVIDGYSEYCVVRFKD